MLKTLHCYRIFSNYAGHRYDGRIYATRVVEYPEIWNVQFFIGNVLIASKWDITYELETSIPFCPSQMGFDDLPDYQFEEFPQPQVTYIHE